MMETESTILTSDRREQTAQTQNDFSQQLLLLEFPLISQRNSTSGVSLQQKSSIQKEKSNVSPESTLILGKTDRQQQVAAASKQYQSQQPVIPEQQQPSQQVMENSQKQFQVTVERQQQVMEENQGRQLMCANKQNHVVMRTTGAEKQATELEEGSEVKQRKQVSVTERLPPTYELTCMRIDNNDFTSAEVTTLGGKSPAVFFDTEQQQKCTCERVDAEAAAHLGVARTQQNSSAIEKEFTSCGRCLCTISPVSCGCGSRRCVPSCDSTSTAAASPPYELSSSPSQVEQAQQRPASATAASEGVDGETAGRDSRSRSTSPRTHIQEAEAPGTAAVLLFTPAAMSLLATPCPAPAAVPGVMRTAVAPANDLDYHKSEGDEAALLQDNATFKLAAEKCGSAGVTERQQSQSEQWCNEGSHNKELSLAISQELRIDEIATAACSPQNAEQQQQQKLSFTAVDIEEEKVVHEAEKTASLFSMGAGVPSVVQEAPPFAKIASHSQTVLMPRNECATSEKRNAASAAAMKDNELTTLVQKLQQPEEEIALGEAATAAASPVAAAAGSPPAREDFEVARILKGNMISSPSAAIDGSDPPPSSPSATTPTIVTEGLSNHIPPFKSVQQPEKESPLQPSFPAASTATETSSTTTTHTWYPGFRLQLGAEGRQVLLRRLRRAYHAAPAATRDAVLASNGLYFSRVPFATVSDLFKLSHLLGVFDFAVQCSQEFGGSSNNSNSASNGAGYGGNIHKSLLGHQSTHAKNSMPTCSSNNSTSGVAANIEKSQNGTAGVTARSGAASSVRVAAEAALSAAVATGDRRGSSAAARGKGVGNSSMRRSLAAHTSQRAAAVVVAKVLEEAAAAAANASGNSNDIAAAATAAAAFRDALAVTNFGDTGSGQFSSATHFTPKSKAADPQLLLRHLGQTAQENVACNAQQQQRGCRERVTTGKSYTASRELEPSIFRSSTDWQRQQRLIELFMLAEGDTGSNKSTKSIHGTKSTLTLENPNSSVEQNLSAPFSHSSCMEHLDGLNAISKQQPEYQVSKLKTQHWQKKPHSSAVTKQAAVGESEVTVATFPETQQQEQQIGLTAGTEQWALWPAQQQQQQRGSTRRRRNNNRSNFLPGRRATSCELRNVLQHPKDGDVATPTANKSSCKELPRYDVTVDTTEQQQQLLMTANTLSLLSCAAAELLRGSLPTSAVASAVARDVTECASYHAAKQTKCVRLNSNRNKSSNTTKSVIENDLCSSSSCSKPALELSEQPLAGVVSNDDHHATASGVAVRGSTGGCDALVENDSRKRKRSRTGAKAAVRGGQQLTGSLLRGHLETNALLPLLLSGALPTSIVAPSPCEKGWINIGENAVATALTPNRNVEHLEQQEAENRQASVLEEVSRLLLQLTSSSSVNPIENQNTVVEKQPTDSNADENDSSANAAMSWLGVAARLSNAQGYRCNNFSGVSADFEQRLLSDAVAGLSSTAVPCQSVGGTAATSFPLTQQQRQHLTANSRRDNDNVTGLMCLTQHPDFHSVFQQPQRQTPLNGSNRDINSAMRDPLAGNPNNIPAIPSSKEDWSRLMEKLQEMAAIPKEKELQRQRHQQTALEFCASMARAKNSTDISASIAAAAQASEKEAAVEPGRPLISSLLAAAADQSIVEGERCCELAEESLPMLQFSPLQQKVTRMHAPRSSSATTTDTSTALAALAAALLNPEVEQNHNIDTLLQQAAINKYPKLRASDVGGAAGASLRCDWRESQRKPFKQARYHAAENKGREYENEAKSQTLLTKCSSSTNVLTPFTMNQNSAGAEEEDSPWCRKASGSVEEKQREYEENSLSEYIGYSNSFSTCCSEGSSACQRSSSDRLENSDTKQHEFTAFASTSRCCSPSSEGEKCCL